MKTMIGIMIALSFVVGCAMEDEIFVTNAVIEQHQDGFSIVTQDLQDPLLVTELVTESTTESISAVADTELSASNGSWDLETCTCQSCSCSGGTCVCTGCTGDCPTQQK